MDGLTVTLTKRLGLIKQLTNKDFYPYEKAIMEAVLMNKNRAWVNGLYREWKEALEKSGFTVVYNEIGKNGFVDVTISW